MASRRPNGAGPSVLRGRVWLMAAALLMIIGTLGSILGAQSLARIDSQRSHEAFVTSSLEIAATLKLTIQHEEDLVVTAGAFVVRDPNVSQADFLQWSNSVRAFQRYPEVIGIAELELVPATQLAAFAARAEADPPGPLAADGTFQVTPTGNRPYYCLAASSISRAPSTTPAGLDFCATELGPALLKARDTGMGAYVPYGTGKSAELVLGTPVYRGGGVPTSVPARRSAFIGWTGTSTRPSVILATALVQHPHTAVAFHYSSKSSNVTINAGSAPVGADSTTVNLQNGWRVQVFGSVKGGGVFANGSALALLVGGTALFFLLSAVFYLLATSRVRAMQMVNQRTEELRQQAFHDSLTGLPNRALILDRVDQMLARTRRDHTPVAALFLDLDDFKDINDTLGHDAGDQLLVEVGKRLTSALRKGDSVGRLGGDEFVILVEGKSLDAGPEVVAQRILDALSDPIEIALGDAPLTVTASIGIAVGDRTTPYQLLRDADIALYRAKASGKQCAVLFSHAMQQSVDEHRHLEVDLHRALENGEFFLLYQPTVDLATGAFTGVEALIRWRHPVRGIVGPDEFVPALESSGLIVPVGRWVLEMACRQGAIWRSQHRTLTVSVNVSAVQLERDRIIDDVTRVLDTCGLDPATLILELTETALMNDVQASLARLKRLKALGVGIAIDDFGTGYSSLAYLRQFPIDVLKIDQSFVSGIAESSESAAIVHTLVQLGKVLGLKMIAEGIENHDQLERLRSEGIDIGQGFLFARPLDVAAVDQLLDRFAESHRELPALR